MRHYFTGKIILEIILTIQNMEMYYRKPGSGANNKRHVVDVVIVSITAKPYILQKILTNEFVANVLRDNMGSKKN